MARQQFLNNYSVVLVAPVGANDSTIDVSNALPIPALSGGDYYVLTLKNGNAVENVKVTTVDAQTGYNRLTVVRGVDVASNGNGQAFAVAGTSVFCSISKEYLDELYAKLAPLNPDFEHQVIFDTGTVSITLDPSKLIQIDLYVTGVDIDIACAGAVSKRAVFLLYRNNQSDPWPTIKINNSVATIDGSAPEIGAGYRAVLLVEYFPGTSYAAGGFTHCRWEQLANQSAHASGGGGASPFSTSVIYHGILYSGTTLHIPTDGSEPAHTVTAQANSVIDFDSNPNASTFCCEVFISVELYSTPPTIKYVGGTVTVSGSAPPNGGVGLIRALFIGGTPYIQWIARSAYV